jgi:hypothetical protein
MNNLIILLTSILLLSEDFFKYSKEKKDEIISKGKNFSIDMLVSILDTNSIHIGNTSDSCYESITCTNDYYDTLHILYYKKDIMNNRYSKIRIGGKYILKLKYLIYTPQCDSIERQRIMNNPNAINFYYTDVWKYSNKMILGFKPPKEIYGTNGLQWFYTTEQISQGYMIPDSLLIK